jgi:hypothetical protein
MKAPVEVMAGEVRWQVAAEHRALLLGPRGLRLDEWQRRGQVEVVKQGPHRTVYSVALDGLRFFIKHNRLHNLRAWLRQLVRPSKARIEFDHAMTVAARGVPTFVPVAVGEHQGGIGPSDSFLITRSLENTETLASFIETKLVLLAPARAARVRQRLARELAGLVARMHDAGIAHQDFHAGNLLVQLSEDDRPSLYVIDLHAMHLGQPLKWRASRDNLVMLNRWFVLRASRSDRLRFWQSYVEARETSRNSGKPYFLPSGLPISDLAREVEKCTWRSNLGFWRSRDRRCLASNRYYRKVRSTVVQGHAVADLDCEALAALLVDPDEPFRRPTVRLLKDSRSSTVAELSMRAGGVLRAVIYKRFRVTAWTDPWAALVRRSPALRSWVHGHGLCERRVPTARPLAVLHRRSGGLCHEGYLLTEKIEEGVELHAYARSLAALPGIQRQTCWRRLIEQVASVARELHCRQVSHRDFKAANILVLAPPGQLAEMRCWLIDLVGMETYARLPRSRRVQNLARLHASFHGGGQCTRSDKLRFLRTYLQWGLHGREGWKRWWHQIAAATRAKIARNQRNRRPLA